MMKQGKTLTKFGVPIVKLIAIVHTKAKWREYFLKRFFFLFKIFIFTLRTMMALIECKRSGRTGSPKIDQKVVPPTQDIAIFLHSRRRFYYFCLGKVNLMP